MNDFIVVSNVFLWIVSVFNLLLILAVVKVVSKSTPSPLSKSKGIEAGEQAPHFTLNSLSNGRSITKHDLIGRNIAMVFVSPTCKPCKKALINLEHRYTNRTSPENDLLIVSLGDLPNTNEFLKELDFTYPIVYTVSDPNELMRSYKVQGTPYYCLIDKEGKVKDTGLLLDQENIRLFDDERMQKY